MCLAREGGAAGAAPRARRRRRTLVVPVGPDALARVAILRFLTSCRERWLEVVGGWLERLVREAVASALKLQLKLHEAVLTCPLLPLLPSGPPPARAGEVRSVRGSESGASREGAAGGPPVSGVIEKYHIISPRCIRILTHPGCSGAPGRCLRRGGARGGERGERGGESGRRAGEGAAAGPPRRAAAARTLRALAIVAVRPDALSRVAVLQF